MKKIILSLQLISFSLMLILFSFKKSEDKLVVHEWGTFTTLHGSDGKQLSGLYIEEEHLPPFVYSHTSLADDINDTIYRGKDQYLIKPENVTVKMETPVLYFYSDKSTKVSLQVDFPNGSISQWYPQRSKGDETPVVGGGARAHVDFKIPYKGWINWENVEVLAPNASQPLTPPQNQEIKTWVIPRNTDANKVKVNGETEKFLFYRGLGNFSVPLEIKFDNDNELNIKNLYIKNISYLFVYEKKENGNVNIWWTGSLGKDETKKIDISKNLSIDTDIKFKEFEKSLMDAGLYEREAKAMLSTWEESYFKKPGFRVFWIVPVEEVDKLLPIKIEPRPTEIKRVFVGRSDILTPTFERTLVEDSKNLEKWKKYRDHRYVLGLEARVKVLRENTNY